MDYTDGYLAGTLPTENYEFGMCYNSDKELQLKMCQSVSALQPYGFEFFDLMFTAHDFWLLSHLHAQEDKTLNLCSNLGQLQQIAEEFIKTSALPLESQYLAADIAKLIAKLTRNALAASGYDDAQVSIVTSLNDPLYFPYWHIDKTHSDIVSREKHTTNRYELNLLFALKGETTLYHSINESIKHEFNKLANETSYVYGYGYSIHDYVKGEGLDKMFKLENSKSPNYGQGSVHIKGYEYGTIHAVPDTTNRVLLIVSPNSHQKMQAFAQYMEKLEELIAKYFFDDNIRR